MERYEEQLLQLLLSLNFTLVLISYPFFHLHALKAYGSHAVHNVCTCTVHIYLRKSMHGNSDFLMTTKTKRWQMHTVQCTCM